MATKCTSSVYGDKLRKVTAFEDLERAMHILWWSGSFYHHGIVVSVDEDSKIVNVIHLHAIESPSQSSLSSSTSGDYLNTKGIITIDPKIWPDQMDLPKLYYLHYDDGTCLPADNVIKNGIERMRINSTYKILTNNCEHFATYCKTGEAKSAQSLLGSAITSSVASPLVSSAAWSCNIS